MPDLFFVLWVCAFSSSFFPAGFRGTRRLRRSVFDGFRDFQAEASMNALFPVKLQ